LTLINIDGDQNIRGKKTFKIKSISSWVVHIKRFSSEDEYNLEDLFDDVEIMEMMTKCFS
jgi:hypothetical protein